MVELKKGILKEYYDKIKLHFITEIDPGEHIDAYRPEHGYWFAGPEFAGKYIDICMRYYQDTRDAATLNNAALVVSSILKHQKDSGYIGGLTKENEWSSFSVWNQTFTILGLLSYWKMTGDQEALEAAEKCAQYIARHYLNDASADILDALNFGTQNISIFFVLPDLYEITGNGLYMDFMHHIITRMKSGNLNFFEFEDMMELESKKGIENFLILLGMLKYAAITGDQSANAGVERYWKQVNETQIRNTGNGTLKEFWTENGNAPAMLHIDQKPNENCVAVGWIELSYQLFLRSNKVKYLDAIEKTLFNHILGGVSEDGRDFAYYQPNYGHKILATTEKQYQCCRYRGFALFSNMPEALYHTDRDFIIPLVYASSHYCCGDVSIEQTTDYPFDSRVEFRVKYVKAQRKLKLRIPSWCESYSLVLNGKAVSPILREGYLTVDLEDNLHIRLVLDMELKYEEAVIDGIPRLSASYGPLLLALDSHFGAPIFDTVLPRKSQLHLRQVRDPDSHHLEFICGGMVKGSPGEVHLVDYLSAAKASPEDEFLVWIPIHPFETKE